MKISDITFDEDLQAIYSAANATAVDKSNAVTEQLRRNAELERQLRFALSSFIEKQRIFGEGVHIATSAIAQTAQDLTEKKLDDSTLWLEAFRQAVFLRKQNITSASTPAFKSEILADIADFTKRLYADAKAGYAAR